MLSFTLWGRRATGCVFPSLAIPKVCGDLLRVLGKGARLQHHHHAWGGTVSGEGDTAQNTFLTDCHPYLSEISKQARVVFAIGFLFLKKIKASFTLVWVSDRLLERQGCVSVIFVSTERSTGKLPQNSLLSKQVSELGKREMKRVSHAEKLMLPFNACYFATEQQQSLRKHPVSLNNALSHGAYLKHKCALVLSCLLCLNGMCPHGLSY